MLLIFQMIDNVCSHLHRGIVVAPFGYCSWLTSIGLLNQFDL